MEKKRRGKGKSNSDAADSEQGFYRLADVLTVQSEGWKRKPAAQQSPSEVDGKPSVLQFKCCSTARRDTSLPHSTRQWRKLRLNSCCAAASFFRDQTKRVDFWSPSNRTEYFRHLQRLASLSTFLNPGLQPPKSLIGSRPHNFGPSKPVIVFTTSPTPFPSQAKSPPSSLRVEFMPTFILAKGSNSIINGLRATSLFSAIMEVERGDEEENHIEGDES
ncbi:hypothetical protein PHSY_004056 [Pseudozyma hubeiensis SY62]|uniref:Uncharacterized protein n=1 Tax=Pseudozyma hubeiensis (strain SY62) TaxID=1305764 RepID=R9P537_PSEHS|nr:hypothetical protein PHSY_004056 [Pseudozyma hubeiensis SY62]GAC96476.1 hypothetical protein PHSY_004056 [Pseudozyma hubeiensis SY62]